MELGEGSFEHESPFATWTEHEAPDGNSLERATGHVFADEPRSELGGFEGETARVRFRRKLLEGIGKLDPATGGGISFGSPTSSGRYYKVDWQRRHDKDFSKRAGGYYRMLVLKRGKSPEKAIKRIVEMPHRWSLDCAYFVQVAHLYALSQINPAAFDRKHRSKPFFLRYHGSTGIRPRYYFDKERIGDDWKARFPKRPGAKSTLNPINTARWTEDRIKMAMPVGSRLMWRNNLIKRGESAFRNENAVKVGNDRYRAFGFGIRRHMSEDEIKTKLAEETMHSFPDPADPQLPLAEYTRRHVFLSEAQSFRGS